MVKPPIDFVAWVSPHHLAPLLKEWTGNDYGRDYPIMNAYMVSGFRRDTQEFVATCMVWIHFDPFWHRKWAMLENVYVKKGYRRMGIGRDLVNAACEEARGNKCQFIKLTSGKDKKEGIKLYRSLGWTEGCSFRKELE